MYANFSERNQGSGRINVEFSFTAPGSGTSGDLTTVDGSDQVASIAHVGGSNKMTVTLKRPFNKVAHAEASIIGTAGKRATIGGITNEASGTALVFDIYTW